MSPPSLPAGEPAAATLQAEGTPPVKSAAPKDVVKGWYKRLSKACIALQEATQGVSLRRRRSFPLGSNCRAKGRHSSQTRRNRSSLSMRCTRPSARALLVGAERIIASLCAASALPHAGPCVGNQKAILSETGLKTWANLYKLQMTFEKVRGGMRPSSRLSAMPTRPACATNGRGHPHSLASSENHTPLRDGGREWGGGRTFACIVPTVMPCRLTRSLVPTSLRPPRISARYSYTPPPPLPFPHPRPGRSRHIRPTSTGFARSAPRRSLSCPPSPSPSQAACSTRSLSHDPPLLLPFASLSPCIPSRLRDIRQGVL